MAQVERLADGEKLAAIIGAQIGRNVGTDNVELTPYAHDTRNGWNTYLVTVVGIGLVGFMDGNFAG
jgi:hypothetical protein